MQSLSEQLRRLSTG
ncbi:hypothetical protein ACQT32_27755 [Klebsiella pneumoniae]|nr:hypothetical protein [Enterococcus faecalis]MDK8197883.1 hypothetical protein [Enterococcus faecalis]